MKKAGRIRLESVRNSLNRGVREFEYKNTKKRALASMGKPCAFLAPETQKTQEFPEFFGAASFLTASSERVGKNASISYSLSRC